MRTSDFKFQLPKKLISRYPNLKRSECRLLVFDRLTTKITHHFFSDLPEILNPGDLLIFNDTRVIPARLYGYSVTGKKVEILIERILNDYQAVAHIYSSELVQLGEKFILGSNLNIYIYVIKIYYSYKLFKIYFDNINYNNVLSLLNDIGHIPIPPYFHRLDEIIDYELYQTVYGSKLGSIAAPTAGLHFDTLLINRLLNLGIEISFITLHIGSATFQPVRVTLIEHHVMHDEYIEVSQSTIESILRCKERKNRVIAVGTTVVKALETAAMNTKSLSIIESFSGYSRIFIFPGYRFKIVDSLITNFHLPESTLIMLVAAFAGYRNILRVYNAAIDLNYKFLSYGDSMFITCRSE
ncbi:S-adenosylmethionine:tRNA ribosyltransferase-isomerase [Candidatus Blochmanniella floridana]|uniref:S-adenosylmethionine:tRNA ribosyltransferase-isomerase n=1 Tax=Blochmanniella floridana TaxID=203907 RepID=QUEA_BLOFL|nr:RecName: Full=S-adenosylmethionine:tRNA ribosyltransferase-isomerase; AltName: Full=Queuosine biosynthesis protein QueA [Candidatus Blochmannia floridanus]CAD83742.1 S-adenosylmethionine:tRNA ribosyltransferase-isomerase [Candidatus Blochmannia floridanus]